MPGPQSNPSPQTTPPPPVNVTPGTTNPGTVATITPLTTPAFPPSYVDPLTPDTQLQLALNTVVAAQHPGSWPVSMCVVALPTTSGGAYGFGSTTANQNLNYFTASLAKVAPLYAAHELRKTMRDIAAEMGAKATPTNLIPTARAYLNPLIMATAGPILAKAVADPRNVHAVTLANKLPDFDAMFDVQAASTGSGVTVEFKSTYQTNLHEMISVSSNGDARACVHGLGYGYLSGVLSSAGFFDPTSMTGLWLCADYQSFQDWGALTINTTNDRFSSAVATTYQLAKLFALFDSGVRTGGAGTGPALKDSASCTDIFALLKAAADVPEVFVTRGTQPLGFTVPRCKLGVAGLKSGPQVCSEDAFLNHSSGRQFIAAWQNFVHADKDWFTASTWEPISWVVRDTLNAYTSPSSSGSSSSSSTSSTPTPP
jgi:hypothetical protein